MRQPSLSSNTLLARDLNQLETQFQDLLRPVATQCARLCVEKVEQERASGAGYSHSRSVGRSSASTAQAAPDSSAWTRGWFDSNKVPDMPSTSSPATDGSPKTVRRSVLVRQMEEQDKNSKEYYSHIYHNACALASWLSQSHDEDADEIVTETSAVTDTSTSKRTCNLRQVANLVQCVRRNLADPEAANKPKPKPRSSRRRSSASSPNQQQPQQQFSGTSATSGRCSMDSYYPTSSRASEIQVEPVAGRERELSSPKPRFYEEATSPHEERIKNARRSTAINEELGRALSDITSELQRANALSRPSVRSSVNGASSRSSGAVTGCVGTWGSSTDLGEQVLFHKTSVEFSADRNTVVSVEGTLSAWEEKEPSKSMTEGAGPNWGLNNNKVSGSKQSLE